MNAKSFLTSKRLILPHFIFALLQVRKSWFYISWENETDGGYYKMRNQLQQQNQDSEEVEENMKSIVHYEIMVHWIIIIADVYCQLFGRVNKILCRKSETMVNRNECYSPLSQCKSSRYKIKSLVWDFFYNLPYSPDLA